MVSCRGKAARGRHCHKPVTDILARLLNILPPSAVKVFPNRVVIRAMQLLAEDMENLAKV